MNSNAELKARTEEILNDIEEIVRNQNFSYYFEDAELEYRINSKLEYVGVYIFLEQGGPTTWIDTYNQTLNSSWGSYKASVSLSFEVIEILNEFFREEYSLTRGE